MANPKFTGSRLAIDRGPQPQAYTLDDDAGGTYRDKPIADVDFIVDNLNRTGDSWYHDAYGALDNDNVVTFGFWTYDEVRSTESYYVSDTIPDYYFAEAYIGYFSAFTPGQEALAVESLGLWDELINIDFAQVDSALDADITFGNTYTGGAQAYAYLPSAQYLDDEPYYQIRGFGDIGRVGGDVWIDGFVSSNFFPLDDSYYAQTTMVHELGHALGLSHPGDYNATDDDDGDGVPDPITYEADAAFAQDSRQYSIMSYFDAYETGAQHIDFSLLNFSFAATPLVHDIAAIQAIYGTDYSTRAGNTIYGFNSNTGESVYDFTQNTRPVIAIWDGAGKDTLDFSGWSTDSVINLNDGEFSSGGGIVEFLSLEEVNANRAAIGFAPRTQDDYDYYMSLVEEQGLTNGLIKDNISIAYGVVIENGVGGAGNDTIFANEVANLIKGGAGSDLVSYDEATAGVDTSLVSGGRGGYAAGDKYTSIENLAGSEFNDRLMGDQNANRISGAGGNDTIWGGDGKDTMTGGAGVDVVTGEGGNDVIAGDAGADKLAGGDGDDVISGGADNDELAGNVGNDDIAGATGNDLINGNQGDDYLAGQQGLDTLIGGSGSDVFRFDFTGPDRDNVRDFIKGEDKLDLHNIDAIASTASDDAFSFIGTGAFTAAGQVRYMAVAGGIAILGDVDGDKVADFSAFLQGVKTLTADDFLIL